MFETRATLHLSEGEAVGLTTGSRGLWDGWLRVAGMKTACWITPVTCFKLHYHCFVTIRAICVWWCILLRYIKHSSIFIVWGISFSLLKHVNSAAMSQYHYQSTKVLDFQEPWSSHGHLWVVISLEMPHERASILQPDNSPSSVFLQGGKLAMSTSMEEFSLSSAPHFALIICNLKSSILLNLGLPYITQVKASSSSNNASEEWCKWASDDMNLAVRALIGFTLPVLECTGTVTSCESMEAH